MVNYTWTLRLPATRRTKEGSMPSPCVEKEAGVESISPLQFGLKESVGVGERNLHFDLDELFFFYMGTRNVNYSERKEGVCS